MSRIGYVICSAAAVALICAALFALSWFDIELGASTVQIGPRSLAMCIPGEGCHSIGFGGMRGAYPVLGTIAFWASLPLALLVLVQCLLKLVTGSASSGAARVGYGLGAIVFLCTFAAGYLFAPESDGMFEVMGIAVTRSWGPAMLLVGSLLAMIAVRVGLHELRDDTSGEYKPIVLPRDSGDGRLPVTPLHVKQISPTAGAPAQGRSMTPHGQLARVHTPTGPQARLATPPGRERLPDSLPLEGGVPGYTRPPTQPGSDRTKSPSQPGSDRTKSPSQPGSDRTKSPSQPGSDRTKSPSQQPFVARTVSPSYGVAGGTSAFAPAERTKSPSQQPLVARTPSPSQLVARTSSPDLAARMKSPSQPGTDSSDLPERARTSSSGPIDLAARLHGAPIGVTIKPPLPERVPVPADQIPVAPESGLVIRKRTQSAAPLSAAATAATAAAAGTATATATAAATATATTTGAEMPSVALRGSAPAMSSLEDLGDLAHHEFGGPTQRDALHDVGAPAYREAPHEFGGPTQPLEGPPPPLRGKLHYAVVAATLTATGIRGEREDGTTKQVAWDSIVGIIARRLPHDEPYDSHTFVDLVSTAGSTLRILPWTKLDGIPLAGDGEERARAFLRLVAARCLDAKLDSWTRVFADGIGHAAQLPNEKTLASHDEIIA